MDDFCGSEYWNLNLTWNTFDPDFTPCFEQTMLVWAPCIFLWLFYTLDIFYIKNSLDKNIPWNFLNVSKLGLTLFLIILTLADLISALSWSGDSQIYDVDYFSPLIKLISFILTAIIVFYNVKNGVRTSGLMFLFWFFLTILSIPRCRTEARNKYTRIEEEITDSWAEYKYISFMVFFACSCCLLILNCFADKSPRQRKYPKTEKECPEVSSSYLSRATFQWFDRLSWKGFRNPLVVSDLWDLPPENASKEIMSLFDKYYKKQQQYTDIPNNKSDNENAAWTKKSTNINFTASSKDKNPKRVSVMGAIVKSFGGIFLFGAFLKLITDALVFASPQILSLIINYVQTAGTNPEPEWHGIFYALLLFIVALTQTFLSGQYYYRMFIVGLRIRTALNNAIYRKALVISNSARKESTVGEIVNLMAVDAQRFIDLTQYVNLVWSAPFQIAVALYFLWERLGPSVLAGLIVMIVLIPLNGVIANKAKGYQIRQMKNKDERVKLVNEILNGMKVLKLYAWEPSFERRVLDIRDREISILRSLAYLNSGTTFLWTLAPFLVSLVTFATFVLVDENNILDANTAFVSLSLFNILRGPLALLPMMITNLIQTQVSVKRINKFLNSDELDTDNVQHDPSEPSPLLIKNGTFSWGDKDIVLRDINFEVAKGELAAVVGAVGSGKSSLISALLGEMDKISGRVNTHGQIAYVPQQAWIQNATLRDNILFGNKYDRKKYDRVIEACALKPDIEMLTAGDSTEIGEKGINLSGGQKQRVSLARAVYNDSEIYLFDDPLSAVDSHVGKHIFEEVLGPKGILNKKTRILVTHGIVFLPEVNKITVIKDGEISETGTYRELLNKKGAFADFLLQHLQEANPEDIEEIDEIKMHLEATVDNLELRTKFERAISQQRSEASNSDTASINSSINLDSGDRHSLRLRSSRSSRSINRHNSIKSQSSDKMSVNQENAKLIDIELAETGNVKLSVYKHYLQSLGIGLGISTIVLNILYQVFATGSNLWLTEWSNDKDAGTDTSKRDMYLGVYGGLGAGQVITNFISTITFSLGSLYASREIHSSLINNVMKWPLSLFDTTPTGRIINRFSKDVEVVDNYLPALIRFCLPQIFLVIATIIVISISTPIFLAVIVPIAVLYYMVQRFYIATSRQLTRLESLSRSPIYSHFSETITGAQTIRAYKAETRFIADSENRVDINQACKYPNTIANRWLAIRLETIGNLVVLFAALFAVLGGQSNPGLVGLSVSYAMQITQILSMIVRMASDVETNIVSVERLKEYSERETEAPWELANSLVTPDWPQHGQVEFQDFKVRYREGLDLVLRGINFTVSGGEKVGIVGRTGAGKSSLTLALFRIIESAGGKILIDGIDISKLGLHALRSRLTIIPQEPVLFSGTLRINLDPFDNYSDEEIWTSLKNSHLNEFAKGLAAGLNHEINEGGENLSVGQRQLICLARALLRKTKVLILDEATAAVDLETDDLIQNTIRTEFRECTVLTIAHRLNTIMDSDKVLVLDRGEVLEFASPTELLENKQSAFYSMAKDAGLTREHNN